jgi:hypothetical protein
LAGQEDEVELATPHGLKPYLFTVARVHLEEVQSESWLEAGGQCSKAWAATESSTRSTSCPVGAFGRFRNR